MLIEILPDSYIKTAHSLPQSALTVVKHLNLHCFLVPGLGLHAPLHTSQLLKLFISKVIPTIECYAPHVRLGRKGSELWSCILAILHFILQ
jgi:hypothetical protein